MFSNVLQLLLFLSIEYMMCFGYYSLVDDIYVESEKWRWKQLWCSFQASLCTKAINESSVDKSYHCMKHNNNEHYSWGAIICHRENNMLTTQVAKPWIAYYGNSMLFSLRGSRSKACLSHRKYPQKENTLSIMHARTGTT